MIDDSNSEHLSSISYEIVDYLNNITDSVLNDAEKVEIGVALLSVIEPKKPQNLYQNPAQNHAEKPSSRRIHS